MDFEIKTLDRIVESWSLGKERVTVRQISEDLRNQVYQLHLDIEPKNVSSTFVATLATWLLRYALFSIPLD